jgi:hypothetical protein
MRLLVFDPLHPFVDGLLDPLEATNGGNRLSTLDEAYAREELGRDEVVAASVHLLEQTDCLFVLAIAVLVPPQHIVELPVQVALLRVVEPRDLGIRVLADALDDIGGLGELGCQLRQPQQGFPKLEVVLVVGNHAEDCVAGLVELEAIKGDG